jgi:hypothetical protein
MLIRKMRIEVIRSIRSVGLRLQTRVLRCNCSCHASYYQHKSYKQHFFKKKLKIEHTLVLRGSWL